MKSNQTLKNKILSAVRSRFGFSLLINLVVIFVSIFLFHPFFEENDDVGIAMLAEGAYGIKDAHLIISSTVLGKILVGLQTLFGSVRWHAVLQYLFLFISFTALTYCLSKDKKGKVLASFLLLSLFYECYVALQFTKTTMVVAAIGYLILFYLADNEQGFRLRRIFIYVTAYSCLFYSMILRGKFFYAVTGIIGVYGLVWLFKDSESVKKKAKYGCIFFAPVFVLFALLNVINTKSYEMSPEWNGYLSYNVTRAEMNDFHYGALNYGEHGEELRKMGVSENDAYMYLTWQIADDTVLTVEKMEEIATLDNDCPLINLELIKAWVANIYEELFVVSPLVEMLAIGLILYILLLFSNRSADNKAKVIGIVLQFAVVIGLFLFFQISGRWNHRPVYGVLLVEIILLTVSLNDEEIHILNNRSLIWGLAMFILLSVIGLRFGNEFDYQKYRRSRKEYDALLEQMENNKDTLYVIDTFTLINPDKYAVFAATQEGRLSNFVNCGGWYMNSPVLKKLTLNYGYENPFIALESRGDNVVLIDNCYPERKLNYCREHGDGNDYLLNFKETIGGYNLYTID